MLNSAELAQLSWAWKKFQNFVSILRFINKTNFMLSWVEHEKFYNLGAWTSCLLFCYSSVRDNTKIFSEILV